MLRCIGKGGFGEVYLAEMSTATGFTKTVALKLMREDADGKPDVEQRMRDEARMLGMLRHRTIVQADDLITLSGRPAVVMEYIPGINHSTLINPKINLANIPPRVILSVIRQIADALDVAYNRPSTVTNKPLNVLHRDIKPANVRITPDGEVKVLDFGIARSDHMEREAETQEYQLGSLPYMAPELMDGGMASPASDIYSLGVTFYESVARKRFGWAGEADDLHGAQVETRMSQLDMADFGDQTDTVHALLASMLAFDSSDRPAAKDVARQCRDIERKVEGLGLEEWAPEGVQALQSEEEEADEGALSGRVLVEDSSSARLPKRPRDFLNEDTLKLDMDSDASTTAFSSLDELALEEAVAGPEVGVQVQPSAEPKHKVRDIVVLVLLLVVTCVVAATFILEPWTEEELPAVAVQQAPAPAAAETRAAEEAEAKEAEAKEAEARETEAKEAEAREAKANARESRPARVTKKAPTAPAASTEPVPIRINTKPFGIPVSVDGGPPQDTPLTGLELKPGKHTLRFLDGDTPFETTITVTSEGKKLWTYKKLNRSIQ
jgi:serine/threonine protein kinase